MLYKLRELIDALLFISKKRKFDGQSVDMDIRGLKLMILTMLKSLFGDNGAAIPVDILKFNQKQLRAYLRFPAK